MSFKENENLLNRLGEDAEHWKDPFYSWLSDRHDILDAAEDIWTCIVKAYDTSSTTLNLVCLSIAALGDYLSQALSDIARGRGINDDLRSALWLLPESVCQPLLLKMQN